MQDETKERWKELCEQAATEEDSRKLDQLVQEINDLLEEKQARLRKKVAVGQTKLRRVVP
jgi:hypothetical protein